MNPNPSDRRQAPTLPSRVLVARARRRASAAGFTVAWLAIALLVATAATPSLGRSGALAADRGAHSAHAADAKCPELPAPQGAIREVRTEPELQGAIRELESGDVVVVNPGVYRLTKTLHVTGGVRSVEIRGKPGSRDEVILQGPGMSNTRYGNVPHGILVSDAADVLIADLTIRDVYYHPIQIQGEQGAHDLLFYNLRLIDAGEQFIKGSSGGPPGPYADDGEVACSVFEYTDRARSDYTNGVDVLAGANWVVRDNVFLRIRAPRGQLAGPTVLFWRNSVNTLVERNLFVECDRGIAMGLSRPDTGRARDGEGTYDHQASVVRNNMVYQPAGTDTTDIGITVNYARDFKVLHNTVILNGTFPWGAIEYRFAASRGEIRGNLTDAPIWRRDGAVAALEDNIVDAPLSWFVAPSAADLHLTSRAARAIDQAEALRHAVDDYDGDRRPIGPAADIGADEYAQGRATATRLASPTPTARTPTASLTATPRSEVTATDASTPAGTSTATSASPHVGRLFIPLCESFGL